MSKEKEAVKEEEVRRSFTYTVNDEDKTFYLGMPTSEQIRQAEWHYSKIYNRALVEGVATTSEMVDILTKRGIYGPDYEKKLQELQVSIALKLADMQNADDNTSKMKLAREIQGLRDELYRWNQRITGPLSNSCEQMADDAKTEYLTSVVIQTEDGSTFWDDYEAFVTETNQGLALKSRFEVLLWLQGLDSDFLDKTPENETIRSINLQKAESELLLSAAAASSEVAETPEETIAPSKKTKKSTKKASKGSTPRRAKAVTD